MHLPGSGSHQPSAGPARPHTPQRPQDHVARAPARLRVPAAQRGARQAPLTQVVRDVAQVRLDHGGVQGQVMAQQLEVPGVVFKVRLTRETEMQGSGLPVTLRGSTWVTRV